MGRPLIVALLISAIIAEREARELAQLVATDPLTRLANRRGLEEQFGRLQRQLSPGDHLAATLLDIDHFKAVNDRFGHAVGDQVLQGLARTLLAHAAAGDVLARLGGEEFVWIMAGADPGRLLARLEGLRADFSAGTAPLVVTVSACVVVAPAGTPALALPELLARADQALYRAKEAGRDRTHSVWSDRTPVFPKP